MDALLEELYARVPAIGCKGLCTESCGPIDGGFRELVRLRRAGVYLPPRHEAIKQLAVTGDYTCPALVDGRCSAYEVRPMVCRLWGSSKDLACPYKCRTLGGEDLLTSAEALALLDAARVVGTLQDPKSVEWFEQMLADPEMARAFREGTPRPVVPRPTPKTAT
jgi:Fe-S-cluster containining protein